MTPDVPSPEDYAAERARHGAGEVVDVRAVARGVAEAYRNQVLLDVNDGCLRLSVFEGEYRWHCHPDSDELFVVVSGDLRIEFDDGREARLTEWQALVVPAGTVHRTRAVGRTVNLTVEKQAARTVFVDGPQASGRGIRLKRHASSAASASAPRATRLRGARQDAVSPRPPAPPPHARAASAARPPRTTGWP